MKPICRFLLSSLLLAIALAPIILLAACLSYLHDAIDWKACLAFYGWAEWYRFALNRRKACVEWLLPNTRPRRERAAFLDRSVLHWRG